VGVRVGLELRGVKHVEGGTEPGQLAQLRAQEHVVDEQGLPGVGGHEPHRQPVRRVGASINVADKELLAIQI